MKAGPGRSDFSRMAFDINNPYFKHKVLTVTEKGDFILSRDLHRLSLWDLQLLMNARLSALYAGNRLVHADSLREERESLWHQQLMHIVRDQQQHHQARYELSLAELFTSTKDDSQQSRIVSLSDSP